MIPMKFLQHCRLLSDHICTLTMWENSPSNVFKTQLKKKQKKFKMANLSKKIIQFQH